MTPLVFAGLVLSLGAAPAHAQWRVRGTAPFEDIDGAIVVQARIHAGPRDTSGALVVDTGAGYLALDHAVAWRLALEDSPGAHGLSFDQGRVDSVSLGGTPIDAVGLVVGIDADVIHRATGRSVLGLLGEAPLDHRAIAIDYANDTLTVLEYEGDQPRSLHGTQLLVQQLHMSKRTASVPFELLGDGKVVVRGRVGDGSSATGEIQHWIVDTGATKTALFQPALRDRSGWRNWPSIRGLTAPTLVGTAEATIVTAPSLELETGAGVGLSVRDLDAAVIGGELPQLLGTATGRTIAGLIGYTFLRRFRVVIDYPGRMLLLDPEVRRDPGRPFEYSQIGIQLEWSTRGPVVSGVIHGSSAARAGIRVGDRIIAVDELSGAGTPLFDLTRALEGPPGTRVRLTVGRGAHLRTVRLMRRRLL